MMTAMLLLLRIGGGVSVCWCVCVCVCACVSAEAREGREYVCMQDVVAVGVSAGVDHDAQCAGVCARCSALCVFILLCVFFLGDDNTKTGESKSARISACARASLRNL